MDWTDQQQLTIDERGKNILVAAAAGSGKTAVLVERIRRMAAEEGVPIDSCLIVTFTNAAAAEMKEKIRKSLREKLHQNSRLRDQLDRLTRANISTFHAFALEVIRTHFYLIDLDPDFSICDEAQMEVIREDALDDLLAECFEGGTEDFYTFLDWYSSEKGNDAVRDILRETYDKLQSLPDPWGSLEEKVSELELPRERYMETAVMGEYSAFCQDCLSRMKSCLESAVEILRTSGLQRLADLAENEAVWAGRCLEDFQNQDLDGLRRDLADFPSETLRARKDEKESYDQVKASVKAFRDQARRLLKDARDNLLDRPIEMQMEQIRRTAPLARTLQRLLLRFDEIFAAAKRKKKLLDFSDIEHFCLKILSIPQVAEDYRTKFSHIFIDEYQDTSLLQEAIIAAIARPDNLFMVGDIKQSIYKFRLAEPEIFQRRYEEYRACPDGSSLKIDLNRNFRSKPVILQKINRIFRPIMGGYDQDACLYPGLEEKQAWPGSFGLKLISTAGKKEEGEELADMLDKELEAVLICRLIRENLGREFYDSKRDQVRRLRYRDMVVLMRSVAGSASCFLEIMREQGIPVFIDDNDGYFDTMEIEVALNLLRILDNRYQDIPLLSVLRSEIFSFTTDELARIRVAWPEGSYAEAFQRAAEGTEGLIPGLGDRCAETISRMERWRSLSLAMPLPEFVWRLLMESGYYLIMGAMPEGAQRQANLRSLVDRAMNFSENGQASLYGFIRYLESVRSRKVRSSQVRLLGENDDVVRIMTIHKSKGLEFPMVIVAGMGRKLNYTRQSSRVVFHKDVGMGLYYEDPVNHWEEATLPVRIIASRLHREEVEENIRVLYVALTRARDILYMTGTVRDPNKIEEDKEAGIRSDTTFLGMLDELPRETEIIDCRELAPGAESQEEEDGGAGLQLSLPEGLWEEVAGRLSYRYAYRNAGLIRSKYSVSGLNRRAHETIVSRQIEEKESAGDEVRPETELRSPSFGGEHPVTAAQRGTIYHGIMERLDMDRVQSQGREYLLPFMDQLVRDEVFLPEEIASIDPEQILTFFRTDLGRRCSAAYRENRLWREQTFDLKESLEGEKILIQGVIDCYFEEAGQLTLLDYKSNWVDTRKPFQEEKERLLGMYREQMRLYAQALSQALKLPVKESYLYLFSAGKLIEVII